MTDPEGVAASLNEYIAGNLEQSIPQSGVYPFSFVEPQLNSFVCLDVYPLEIKLIIKAFNSKNCHLYAIPNFMFEHITVFIADPQSKSINQSFREGQFPHCLKCT